ncbi:C-terminal processing protease CtpA/Prc [Actinoalloteichus hoggarensis]|uniref:Peptidase family S41 n=1 Tax=Actinoalloteichus hoggarensis TaxID=1470176 RepID=A0A221W4V7_9PSEU|nr:S41 family peptidase [Actinoalloteichus hoggarensis]ASO20686.1 Peptidase family S41 [Actinoalloteichus hoggarensis]MBB5924461.1 C-terminal processing protease CtpA/Prc [Actinoalloteichus hoggarensis]
MPVRTAERPADRMPEPGGGDLTPQGKGHDRVEDTVVARLAGLIRVWGVVRHFHPWLVWDAVDWEAALARAVDAVLAGRDDTDYRVAVSDMLAVLNDDGTALVDTTPAEGGASAGRESYDGPAALTGPNGELVLVLAGFAHLGGDAGELYDHVTGFLDQMAEASALVVDMRGIDSHVAFSLLPLFGALAGEGVSTPSRCRREHRGIGPQDAWMVGVYQSGISQELPRRLSSWTSPVSVPTVLVFDEANDPGYLEALALRFAGRVSLVHAGARATAVPGTVELLPHGLAARVRSQDILGPDGRRGVPLDATAPAGTPGDLGSPALGAAFDLLGGRRTPAPPPADTLPWPRPARPPRPVSPGPLSVADRIAALAEMWAAVEWFFPHKNLCDSPWEDVLSDLLPTFLAADDETAFAHAVADFTVRMNDGHAIVNHPVLISERGGSCSVPVRVRLLAGDTVVVQIVGDAGGLAVGDVVLAVDDEDTAERRSRLRRRISSSSAAGGELMIDWMLLSGAPDTEARIRVRTAAGIERTLLVPRCPLISTEPRQGRPVFGVLPAGVGYLDLARLATDQVPRAFEAVASAAGLIVDLRSYPKCDGAAVASRLIDRRVAYGIRRVAAPTVEAASAVHETPLTLDPHRPDSCYRGHIAVLVDESTMSLGEEIGLMITAAAGERTLFVGGATNGSIGEITDIRLPQGVRMMFTGADIRGIDGRCLQRSGLQVDVFVTPTLAGVRAGRDEVLEAAVSALTTAPASERTA